MYKKLIDAFYDLWDYTFTSKAKNGVPEKHLRITEFMGKHYCRIIDIICLLIIALTFFSENLAGVGFIIVFIVYGSFTNEPGWFLLFFIVAVAMSVIAYKMIKSDKRTGMIPAIFGGIIGAFTVVCTVNTNYCAASLVKAFFRIFIYFFIYAAVSFSLFWFGYYELDLGWK